MTDYLTFIPQAQMARLRASPEHFAAAARVNILGMVARAGAGHLGGSLSAVDIITWLYLREMRPGDVFILSKGHASAALYAVLHGVGLLTDDALLTFRDGQGGLPAHPCLGTPGIACNTGSLGMGISKAKGMIFADRLRGVQRRYFVLVGDGELQEGQVWEALMPHNWENEAMDLDPLTIIVDHNGIQGNHYLGHNRPILIQEAISGVVTGGNNWLLPMVNGHSLQDLARVPDLAQKHFSLGGNGPLPLVACTTKGNGVSFMENRIAWHSGAPSEKEYEAALAELMAPLAALDSLETFTVPHVWPPPMQPEPLVAAYGRALVEAAERCPELVVLDSDLTKEHGLLEFRGRFPGRFFQCGIAEQDMVGIASGMALRGLTPVVHSHAAFLTRRALDQVHNQVTEGTRVVYVGGSAGKLQPNGNGKSHETLIDGTTMALLGMPVHAPRMPEEVGESLAACLAYPGPSYLRLLKRPREENDP